MDTTKASVSPDRKATYYVGMVLAGIGLLLFLSTFVTFFLRFGDFDNFANRMRSEGICAFAGILLFGVGRFVMRLGARGLAGAGVILDPAQARRDAKPWSQMGGGIIEDALSEVPLAKKLEERLNVPAAQVKVRCRECQALNDEGAKFCNQCASAL